MASGGDEVTSNGESSRDSVRRGKRKQSLLLVKESSSQSGTSTAKRRKTVSKVIPKKKRQDLVKSLRSTDLNTLRSEMLGAVEEQFGDSDFRDFIDELFKEGEPMMEISRQHRDSFAILYGECKQKKNSFMQFQLQYQYHCSAFILEEKYTLDAIKLDESNHTTLVAARKTWMEFCKKCNRPVPESNPVMLAMSSKAYSYLLDQVAIYQADLTDQDTLESIPVGEDDDDVYYRFGGAAICAMLKLRYKELKNCSRTDRNGISIQISMLKAMNLKDKSGIPDYLKYRDRGYMYFPHGSLIPFLRSLDTVVKQSVNEDGFRKHGDDLIKVRM